MSVVEKAGVAGVSTRHIRVHDDESFHPRRVSRLSHSFSDHPLLQLSSLRGLAERFRSSGIDQVKFMRSGATSEDPLKILSEHDQGMSLGEVFERIEEPGSWVSLYNVQTDPEYRELVAEAMACVAPLLDAHDPGPFEADGFIFVSSAPSATPFHIDRENNFFLQIRGRKRMSVWDPSDRVVVPEVDVEDKIGRGSSSKVRFRNEFFERAVFNEELGPGQGVYMPSTAGHTTNTEALPIGQDDTYSVSIGLVYYTKATRRAAYAYALNDRLRRMGLRPRPPYESSMLDRLKYPFGRALVLSKRVAGGFKIPPGM